MFKKHITNGIALSGQLHSSKSVGEKIYSKLIVKKLANAHTHARTHARTHTRMHARMHARTHARTHSCKQTQTIYKHCNYNYKHLVYEHFCGQPQNVVNHIIKTLEKGVSMIWNLIKRLQA